MMRNCFSDCIVLFQDAAGAASQARDKLMERREKLEVIFLQESVR